MPDLDTIASQLDRILAELRVLRDEVRVLRSMRDEVRSTRNTLARMEDSITMDVLDRLRALETSMESK
jgi:prefoldin subunit 5